MIHAVGGAHQKLQPDGLKNILHGRVLSWLILGWAIGRVGASENTTFAASIFCFFACSFGVSIGCNFAFDGNAITRGPNGAGGTQCRAVAGGLNTCAA